MISSVVVLISLQLSHPPCSPPWACLIRLIGTRLAFRGCESSILGSFKLEGKLKTLFQALHDVWRRNGIEKGPVVRG